VFGRTRIDPLARQATTAIAAGRIALGLGALLAPGPALKALGFSKVDGTSVALTRLVGTRDLAVGLLTLAARDDLDSLRAATALSAAVDAGDAVSLSLAGQDPAARRAGLIGASSGTAAALAGLWAWRRLG
jgi:Domain of unknown function (DUF4267)